MGETTAISWTHHTFNPWWGCSFVGGSRACAPAEGEPGAVCYAKTWAERCGYDIWGDDKDRRYFGDKHWAEPLKWNKAAETADERRRVFCMSMGDWAEGRPEQKPHLARLFTELIPETPCLDWLMLTKRPQLIRSLYPQHWQDLPEIAPDNVWMGTTTEDQHWFDIRWPFLRDVPGVKVYWLSIEPMFERIKLPADFLALGKRAWVIVGGQSGGAAVEMAKADAIYMADQCREAGVPFHFKQGSQTPEWGGQKLFKILNNFPPKLQVREFPL